jgi:hypothetical protein
MNNKTNQKNTGLSSDVINCRTDQIAFELLSIPDENAEREEEEAERGLEQAGKETWIG